MSKYEVTYELWYEVYMWALSNGYVFNNLAHEGSVGYSGGVPTSRKLEPVTWVTWRSAIVWCNAYSQMTGRTPVYYSDAGFTTLIKNSTAGTYSGSVNTTPGSFDNPYVNWSCDGFRLPTEGEWQFAARYIDGTTWTPYTYVSGDSAPSSSSATIGDYCWYSGNSGNTSHDVGTKLPNALGIYDMSGNAYEWCFDFYGNYPGTSTDYKGAAANNLRSILGEHFWDDAQYMYVGMRSNVYAWGANHIITIRLARTQ